MMPRTEAQIAIALLELRARLEQRQTERRDASTIISLACLSAAVSVISKQIAEARASLAALRRLELAK